MNKHQYTLTAVTPLPQHLQLVGAGKAMSNSADVIPPEVMHRIRQVEAKLKLSSAASDYLWKCIDEGPSRKVQSRASNVLTNFHSRKTNMRLMLESRSGESLLANLLEFDDSVIAFFPQPPSVHRRPIDKDGKVVTSQQYTPDMLVVRDDEIAIIEVRDEARLLKACNSNPHEFYIDEHDTWHCRSIEAFFADLGMRFELKANRQLPKLLVENTRFLDDYRNANSPNLPADIEAQLRKIIQEARSLRLQDLLAQGFQSDHIYSAVAKQLLFVDLSKDRLADSHNLRLSSDRLIHQALRLADGPSEPPLPVPGTMLVKVGTQIKFGGATYTVLFANDREVLAQDTAGNRTTFDIQTLLEESGPDKALQVEGFRPGMNQPSLADYSPQALERAMKRFHDVTSQDSSIPARTMSRFKARIAHASSPVEALLALMDRVEDRGNKHARIPEKNLKLMEKAITERFNDPRGTSAKNAWETYKTYCEIETQKGKETIYPVSYPTFCKYVNRDASILMRKGKRATYQAKPIYYQLDRSELIHGAYPHDVVYIDHTVANIELTSPHHELNLGKPHLSLAIDGSTGQARAMYLSFDPPSASVVLMVLRDYVRRHQRLPRILALDNGPDFRSRELELFCHIYGIELRFRPPGQPRGGALIERLMYTTEMQMIADLDGNTRILKNDARLVTKSVNPKNHTTWTLPALYGALDQFLFEKYANQIHPAFGVSPNMKEQELLKNTGSRELKSVRFDENIMLLTCPHPPRRSRKVDLQRGVRIHGLYYNHPELTKLKAGSSVEVRMEPWNAGVVYVNTKNRWVAAFTNSSRWHCDRTTKEIEIALREQERKAKGNATKARMARSVKKEPFLTPDMFDPRIATQQGEMKYTYSQNAMCQVPVEVKNRIASMETVTTPQTPANTEDYNQQLPAASSPFTYSGIAQSNAVREDRFGNLGFI